MRPNQIGITFSAESLFRRFLHEIGATYKDIDEGVRHPSEWVFTCATVADAEALLELFLEY